VVFDWESFGFVKCLTYPKILSFRKKTEAGFIWIHSVVTVFVHVDAAFPHLPESPGIVFVKLPGPEKSWKSKCAWSWKFLEFARQ